MTGPMVSGECAAIAMVGIFLAFAGFVALAFATQLTVKAVKACRDARIGRMFRELNQCDHGRAMQLLEVIQVATVDAAIGEAFRHPTNLGLRQARFNEDTE